MPEAELEILLTIVGAALCLGGWVLFYVGSRVVGIGLGLGLGFVFGTALNIVLRVGGNAEQLVLLSCSLLGAIGGFFFVRVATNFLFAAVGFLFGALLARVGADIHFARQNQPFEFTPVIVGVIAGVGFAGALGAVWIQKLIIIIVTSFIGASFLAEGHTMPRAHEPIFFLAIMATAVIWQFFLVKQLLAPGRKRDEE